MLYPSVLTAPHSHKMLKVNVNWCILLLPRCPSDESLFVASLASSKSVVLTNYRNLLTVPWISSLKSSASPNFVFRFVFIDSSNQISQSKCWGKFLYNVCVEFCECLEKSTRFLSDLFTFCTMTFIKSNTTVKWRTLKTDYSIHLIKQWRFNVDSSICKQKRECLCTSSTVLILHLLFIYLILWGTESICTVFSQFQLNLTICVLTFN